MASGNTWADQWDSSNTEEYNNDSYVRKEKGNGKMAKVKVVALSGLEKAKIVASVGAQKVKSGTTIGIKWIKNQYQKRASKR